MAEYQARRDAEAIAFTGTAESRRALLDELCSRHSLAATDIHALAEKFGWNDATLRQQAAHKAAFLEGQRLRNRR